MVISFTESRRGLVASAPSEPLSSYSSDLPADVTPLPGVTREIFEEYVLEAGRDV